MTNSTTSLTQNKTWVKWVMLLVFLAGLAWSARYWLSSGFGLYEDDLTYIPGAIDSSFGEIMREVSGQLSTMGHQGRPLMWSWVILFSYLGWHLGGLQGIYILAFLIWLTNIILFVLLLRRLNTSFVFGLIGGLVYVLFSADTNQAFLFNTLGLQPALTFLMIALHLYLSDGKTRWLAYLFLVLVLINYETPYFLFLAAPLLRKETGKPLIKGLLVNSVMLGVIFVGIYFVRQIAGDTRVAALSIQDMIITPIKHMAIGPAVSLGIYFLRPWLVLHAISFNLALAGLLSAVAMFGLLFWAFKTTTITPATFLPLKKGWWANLSPEVKREMRLLLAGMIMLVFAYPLTIILRPYAISGRETRVHFAGVVGTALIGASVLTLLFRALRRQGLWVVLLGLVSLVLGMNFAFGFVIQKAYVRAWDLQKTFWQALIPLVSDSVDGTAILVEPSGMEDVLYIDANTWVLPRMLERFYVFPDEWERVPAVYRLAKFWEENIVRVPGYFTIDGTNSFAHLVAFGDYDQRLAIYISTDGGVLERQPTMTFMDEVITLKPVGLDIFSSLETTTLYDLMILAD
jgi:hypothetical protein